MVRLFVQLVFLTFNCVLLNVSKRTLLSTHRNYGSKMCRELCQGSDDTFSLMKVYHCRRLTINDLQSREDHSPPFSLICLDQGEAVEGKYRPLKSETVKNKSAQLAGTHGSPCKRNSVCKFLGAKCYHRLCHCKVGYYFDPKTNKCVSRCDAYGDQMVVFKNKGIADHNKRCFNDISLDECLVRCQNETSFVCLTAESGPKCCLSDLGFLDVPKKHQQNWSLMYSLIQRTRCQ